MSDLPINDQSNADNPPMLEYASVFERRRAKPAAAADVPVFLIGTLIMTLVGLIITGVMTMLLILNWPSFGLTLSAVPVYVMAFGCFVVALDAGRATLSGIRRARQG